MTLIKLIKGLLNSDVMDAAIWCQWYVKKGITCKECINTYRVHKNTLPNCYKCGLPVEKLKKSIFKTKETKQNEEF